MESTNTAKFVISRLNQEEFICQGSEGIADRRIVNSYPSKVHPLLPSSVYLSTHSQLIPQMNFDEIKTELSRIKTLTLIFNDTVIDLSQPFTEVDDEKLYGEVKTSNYSHWNRNNPDNEYYLPATFLRQRLCQGNYRFEPQKATIPFKFFLPGADSVLQAASNTGNNWKPSTITERLKSLLVLWNGDTDNIENKPQMILPILHTFAIKKNYSALVDFGKLRDTFDMRVQNDTLRRWKLAMKNDKTDVTQQLVVANFATLKEFHSSLLQCLYFYYIMGFIRIIIYYTCFDQNEHIKANAAYKKELERAGKCIQGDGDLILNSIIPNSTSFCSKEDCEIISKFRRNGSQWQEIFTAITPGTDSKELQLPLMETATVYPENDTLKISWRIEEDEMEKLITTIIAEVKKCKLRTLNDSFPKKKKNTLTIVDPSIGVSDYDMNAMQSLLKNWPIYYILEKQSTLKNEDNIGKQKNLKTDIQTKLSTVLPRNIHDSLKDLMLQRITSHMWSTALQEYVVIMFDDRYENSLNFEEKARAFLELSGLALNYVTYLDRNKNVVTNPELNSDYMKLQLKQSGVTRTFLYFFQYAHDSKQVFFNLKRQNWVYSDVKNEDGRNIERECTEIQSFILFVSFLLQNKSLKQNISILKKLSRSINYVK